MIFVAVWEKSLKETRGLVLVKRATCNYTGKRLEFFCLCYVCAIFMSKCLKPCLPYIKSLSELPSSMSLQSYSRQ